MNATGAQKLNVTASTAGTVDAIDQYGEALAAIEIRKSEADVLAELQNSETGKAYVVSTYDAEGLKRDYGRNAEGREQLAAFGLVLTVPQKHAEVKAR